MAKLAYTPENLKTAIKTVLQKASTDEAYRDSLLKPETSKAEVAKLIETPSNWDDHVIAFEEDDPADVRHFVGILPKITEPFTFKAACSNHGTRMPAEPL